MCDRNAVVLSGGLRLLAGGCRGRTQINDNTHQIAEFLHRPRCGNGSPKGQMFELEQP